MTKILKISFFVTCNVQNLTNVRYVCIWVYLFSRFLIPSSSNVLVIAKDWELRNYSHVLC
jgi:hypothetical protein